MISRKVALVTGASAGFGAAIVTKLVSDGYSVIGCARRMDKLKALEKSFQGVTFIHFKWILQVENRLTKL